MRELKFRQPLWGKHSEFVGFHYWGFIDGSFVEPRFEPYSSYDEAKKQSQQFTGKKDKNGKEGYASDEVSFDSDRPTYLIRWSVCNAGFYLEGMDSQKETLHISNIVVGEIIGNINPKLLEAKNA